MASPQPVTEPLRISKSTPTSSPAKSSIPRPLSEIPVTEMRRNSPSWNQSTKKMTLNTDSSPFQSSPMDSTTSPRLFWQNRNSTTKKPENELYAGRSGSPSPVRRTSIERLQKASRVKNSTMFAREQKQEYDPAHMPVIERPLAKLQGNAFGGTGAAGLRSPHARSESQTSIPIYSQTNGPLYSPTSSPTKTISSPTAVMSPPRSPSKDQTSPMKSSLSASRFKSSQDSQHGFMSADTSFEDRELPAGKFLQRHPKSVTFDAAPPQVNEYEMATPDLSSVGTNSREGSYDSEEEGDDDEYGHYNGEDAASQDDSFDATLEDTDKTPVVGPDDWRGDHPDRFESSPMPESTPSQAVSGRPQHGRTDSSNSDHRPLPPLPGMSLTRTQSTSSTGLSATAERMLGTRRNLPSPPPATASKSEIQNIGNGKMSLEERLKLMMLSDETSPKAADKSAKTFAEQQRERRMRRAGARDRVASPTPERETPKHEEVDEVEEAAEEDDVVGDLSGLDLDYQLPSISRQSILRRVNGNKSLDAETEYNFESSPAPETTPQPATPYDPDIPLPSIEDSIVEDGPELSESSVIINEASGKDGDYGVYQASEDGAEALKAGEDEDSESQYSDEVQKAQPSLVEEDSLPTPTAMSPFHSEPVTNFSATLPQVSTSAKENDLARSFQSYMLPKPKEVDATSHSESHQTIDPEEYAPRPRTPEKKTRALSKPEYDGSGWGEPDEDEEEPGTPDSVIHHPVSDDEDEDEGEEYDELDEPVATPEVPERVATVKASGSKLKTRPSATPSDLMAMREARRQVSREVVPDIPPIPERHRNRISRDLDAENLGDSANDEFLERHPSFKNRSLTLDLDLGLSLDQDFERVIETQKVAFQHLSLPKQPAATSVSRVGQVSDFVIMTYQPNSSLNVKLVPQTPPNANIASRKQRGYLMRQNTKLVAASDKDSEEARNGTRSAGNSPVKQARPQSWTVEPWNGKTRPRSLKKRHGPSLSGPVPPLPGQDTNVTGLNALPETEEPVDLATEECGERGRLFIKVMGVKDLDLPLPRNERTWFSLTLDNGVHCVTTSWLELARNAPIGQEFELVVPNDLEFQLTLNVKLEPPKPQIQRLPTSPTKMSKSKGSTFSRVFASPKKRKEMEARMRAEEEALAQAQREAAAKQMNTAPTAWDLLSPLCAEDGSFARSYVCLKEHETRCYGRPYMAEIAAFNEWAVEEPNFASSVKSKRGGPSNSVVRRAPYKIGKLEVQLLFVPRPKGSTEDDMPKSMNSCIRELKAAEERLTRNWEGHLSQQGGDCPYWRRRYFKLVGTKLTAYHEATRQPRATINLSNAKRLIDDRRQLTNPETMGRGGKRRRSAFAEEEEGYMFVEEGFRIRFNNGEVIDFYADTAEDKDGWMKVLGDVVGRGGDDDDSASPNARRKWCDLVLKREEALRRRAEGKRVHSRTKSMIV